MTKRHAVGITYIFVILMTLLLRISSALGVYDAVGVDADVYFTLTVQILIFGVLPVVGYYLFYGRQNGIGFLHSLNDFRFKKVSGRNFLRTAVIAVGMYTVAGLISYFWQSVLTLIGFKSASTPVNYSSLEVLFIQLLLTALLPGVFEEITHRGLLYAGYSQTGSRFVFVSALLFALMHQNITQTGYTFFDGIIIALVMYYTGSVFPGIYIHIFNNAVSVIERYAAQNGGALNFINVISDWFYGSVSGIITYAVIGALFLGVIIFMFKRMRDESVKKGIIPAASFDIGDVKAIPLHKDAYFIVAVLIGVAAAVFSLVWGIVR